MGVQEAECASYFSYVESLCSFELSDGLFFEAADSVGEDALGRSMFSQGKGMRTKTLEGF